MPKVGQVLLYKLSKSDVSQIMERRQAITGRQFFNPVWEGDICPLIAVRIWPDEYGVGIPGVNGQVILDGEDTLWVTSVGEGEGPGQWKA